MGKRSLNGAPLDCPGHGWANRMSGRRILLSVSRFLVYLISAGVLLLGRALHVSATSPASPSLARACAAAGVRYPPPQPELEVLKSRRVMRLWSGKKRVKEYPISLGFAPQGDKVREGDGKTPEGRFYLCTRNGISRFHRFMGISYPAPEDGARGVKSGLATRAQGRAIRRAHQRRRQPPWNTGLGGAVGIHGGGTGPDWTFGCVAVSNQDAEELYVTLPMGTPVVIRP